MLPLLLLLLWLFFFNLPTSSAFTGFRVELTHVDTMGNFTSVELLQRAVKRSNHRISSLMAAKAVRLFNSTDKVQAPVHAGEGEYLMDFSIGTPPQPFTAIVDTGSDLVWIQCPPCIYCHGQRTPIYYPLSSSTFSELTCLSQLCKALVFHVCIPACMFRYGYADHSWTQGILASETFTFASSEQVSIPEIGFGCININLGTVFYQAAGLVGLGRGPLSLITQLGSENFSYCLTPFGDSKRSLLLFGSQAELNTARKNGLVQSTPIVQNPSMPSFYYLTLKGITIGDDLLPIPNNTFAIKEDGTGGMIIDSGTSITYLEEASYELVEEAFRSQVKLPYADGAYLGLDLCFTSPSNSSSIVGKLPRMVFHFEGADLELPPDNCFAVERHTGVVCLMVSRSNGISVLGNFQQQNIHIVYDLQNEKLSFMPSQCDQM